MSFHALLASQYARLLANDSTTINAFGESLNASSVNATDMDDAVGNDTDDPTQQPPPPNDGRDAYEFVAFLLWYIFLVLCCIIPTCCAYRRRRQVEARLVLQQNTMHRWQAQAANMFVNGHRQDNEQLVAQRSKGLEKELKETTMLVTQDDIEDKEDSGRGGGGGGGGGGAAAAVTSTSTSTSSSPNATSQAEPTEPSLSYDIEDADNAGSLRLPTDATNGARSVPAMCTVCLCAYEANEQVSWSPDTACQHAFHKQCIISWLAKKEEPKCPICRQEFCVLPQVEEAAVSAATGAVLEQAAMPVVHYSFSQSLAQAMHLSRLEAQAVEQRNSTNDANAVTTSAAAGGDEETGGVAAQVEMTTIHNGVD